MQPLGGWKRGTHCSDSGAGGRMQLPSLAKEISRAKIPAQRPSMCPEPETDGGGLRCPMPVRRLGAAPRDDPRAAARTDRALHAEGKGDT